MNHRSALNISDGFRLSADRVIQSFGTTTQELERALMENAAMLPVAVTNLSFAIEIALKTLLSIEQVAVTLRGVPDTIYQGSSASLTKSDRRLCPRRSMIS